MNLCAHWTSSAIVANALASDMFEWNVYLWKKIDSSKLLWISSRTHRACRPQLQRWRKIVADWIVRSKLHSLHTHSHLTAYNGIGNGSALEPRTSFSCSTLFRLFSYAIHFIQTQLKATVPQPANGMVERFLRDFASNAAVDAAAAAIECDFNLNLLQQINRRWPVVVEGETRRKRWLLWLIMALLGFLFNCMLPRMGDRANGRGSEKDALTCSSSIVECWDTNGER